MIPKSPDSNRDDLAQEAQVLAIKGLQFITQDPERLSRFLAISGLEAQDIRTAAAQPGFLGGILEYILADESLLMVFAAEGNMDPKHISLARHHIDDKADRAE